jgi:FkbM family methyltransferase
MKYLNKAFDYSRELLFCLSAGVTIRDKLTLMRETLAFHMNKREDEEPRTFDVGVHVGALKPSLRLRDSGGDVFIFHEVLRDQVYQVRAEWFSCSPRVIVDLGANVGLTSLALAGQFPGARLVAVEPLPANAALLRHNLLCLGDRAHVWEAAVADRAGTLRLSVATENYNASLVRTTDEGVDVRVVTMDGVLSEEGIEQIDVLKIDIEGAERMLLADSPAWLMRVKVILIELHDGYEFVDLERDLAPAGFRVYRHGTAQGVARREGQF